MSVLDVVVSPAVLVGTVLGAGMAVGIGKLFPEYDLTFLQMLVVVGGLLVGVVFELIDGAPPRK